MSDSEAKFVPPEESGLAKTPNGVEQPKTPEQTQADFAFTPQVESNAEGSK